MPTRAKKKDKKTSGAARAHRTRYVRIRLDYVLRLDEEVDGVPGFVGQNGINYLIADGLSASLPKDASCTIMPGARLRATLDFRRDRDAHSGPRIAAGKSWTEEERIWNGEREQ